MNIGYRRRNYVFRWGNSLEIYHSLHDVERILKNFGSCLSLFTIHRSNTIVNDLVAKHCGGGTMKRLEIFTPDCTGDLKLKFSSIYKHLLVLSIRECSTYWDRACQQFNCESLVELNIVKVKECDAFLHRNTFPTLERLTFEQSADSNDWDNNQPSLHLSKFIERHGRLRVLDLKCDNRKQYFDLAIGSCKELKELTLRRFYNGRIFDDQNAHINSLLHASKSLEIVHFKCSYYRIFQDEDASVVLALSQLQNLREVHLTDCQFKSTQWKSLNRLRKLKITKELHRKVTDLPFIISQLTNLEELEIHVNTIAPALSEKDFTDIANIVDGRTNVLTLKCTFSFSDNFMKNCNVYQNVKLIKLE